MARNRLRLLEEDAEVQAMLDMLKRENAWVKHLVFRVARAIGRIGK
jgi:hypothetical protein